MAAASAPLAKISLLAADATGEAEEASYTVTIRLDSTENVRYGMNVVVTTMETAQEAWQ